MIPWRKNTETTCSTKTKPKKVLLSYDVLRSDTSLLLPCGGSVYKPLKPYSYSLTRFEFCLIATSTEFIANVILKDNLTQSKFFISNKNLKRAPYIYTELWRVYVLRNHVSHETATRAASHRASLKIHFWILSDFLGWKSGLWLDHTNTWACFDLNHLLRLLFYVYGYFLVERESLSQSDVFCNLNVFFSSPNRLWPYFLFLTRTKKSMMLLPPWICVLVFGLFWHILWKVGNKTSYGFLLATLP